MYLLSVATFGSADPVAASANLLAGLRNDKQIGYGRKTYAATKDLLSSWGQFQLPWATVAADTPTKPGGPVCVAANVFGLWTAVPLQLLCAGWARAGAWSRVA
jgi:uncharacterized protein (UPF0548 family)